MKMQQMSKSQNTNHFRFWGVDFLHSYHEIVSELRGYCGSMVCVCEKNSSWDWCSVTFKRQSCHNWLTVRTKYELLFLNLHFI